MALRGGGGNFGVATSFEFRCHEVGPEIATCFVGYPSGVAPDALRYFREYATEAPDEVALTAAYGRVPELPEFPEETWGEPGLAIFGAYAGDPEAGEREFRTLRGIAEPIVDLGGSMACVDLQSRDDAFNPPGRYYDWRSLYLDALSDEAIDRLVTAGERAPSAHSTVGVMQLGGAIGRVDATETAYANRDAPFLCTIDAIWDDPAATEENAAWARGIYEEMRAFASRGPYVNLSGSDEDDEGAVRAIYGDNYDRLVEVKSEYDPANLFGLNRNIEPRRERSSHS